MWNFYFCFLSLEELREEITDMHDEIKWLNSVHCKILILTHNDTNVKTRGAMGVGFGLCISCGLEMVVRLDSLV